LPGVGQEISARSGFFVAWSRLLREEALGKDRHGKRFSYLAESSKHPGILIGVF